MLDIIVPVLLGAIVGHILGKLTVKWIGGKVRITPQKCRIEPSNTANPNRVRK